MLPLYRLLCIVALAAFAAAAPVETLDRSPVAAIGEGINVERTSDGKVAFSLPESSDWSVPLEEGLDDREPYPLPDLK